MAAAPYSFHGPWRARALQGGEHGGASAPCCSSDRHAGPWSGDHGMQQHIQLNDLDAKHLGDLKREAGRRDGHVLPRPAPCRVEDRLDRSGQGRREPVRGRRRAGLGGAADGRQHPGEQLQRQGQRPGHRHHHRPGVSGRADQPVRRRGQAARRNGLPGRRRPDHRARHPARRLGGRREPAHHQERRAARPRPGRVPDRAERPGHGGRDHHEQEHRRPVGPGRDIDRDVGTGIRLQRPRRQHQHQRRHASDRQLHGGAPRFRPQRRRTAGAQQHHGGRQRLPVARQQGRARPRAHRPGAGIQRDAVRGGHANQHDLGHPAGDHPDHRRRRPRPGCCPRAALSMLRWA